MVRWAKILALTVFIMLGLAYAHFSSQPSEKVCDYFVLQFMKDPSYYDTAIKLGCSRRYIVQKLNAAFK